MELNRRDFLKGSLAFGGVAALGGLAGCATPQQASNDSAKDAKPEKKSVPDSFTDGKWIGSAMGHDDDLFVQVTVAGGDIAGISVLRCDDTIGIGSTAAPMMATRILEAKNIDVDTVTGATTTSMAVQSAVADAITNAGGNPKDFRLGAATPSGGAAQTADVDVAFMGAGTAGLVAATRLLEAGKTVVLFEKQDIAGGSMPMTYSASPPPNRSCKRTTRSAGPTTIPCTTSKLCWQSCRSTSFPKTTASTARCRTKRPCTRTPDNWWIGCTASAWASTAWA